MQNGKRYAKVNIKVLLILILITAAIVISLFALRQVRRRVFTKMYLDAGQSAFDNKNWLEASKNFKEYLDRNPNDIDILKKYALARLSIRPLDGDIINGAVSAYRRIMQLNPREDIAYDKLALLYSNIDNFEELAYIAQTRLQYFPTDKKAILWLADALINVNKTDEAQQKLIKLIDDTGSVPEKYPEFVQACQRLSIIMIKKDSSPQGSAKALELLDKAISYDPSSGDALVNRARFYLETPSIAGLSRNEQAAAARKDLEAYDKLSEENPQTRFLAGALWLALGEPDKADAEIITADKLAPETIEKYFFDIKGSIVARFLLACDVAAKRGDIGKAVSLSDDVLSNLTEKRHRVQVLPSVIRIYAISGKVQEARKCLDEFLESRKILEKMQQFNQVDIFLRAIVAKAEGKPYLVIDILQPFVLNNEASPDLWRLLADAYSQTDQTRRSINTMLKYLSLYPQDEQMLVKLSQEYLKLQDWRKMLAAANQAISLNPDDLNAKLLRIDGELRAQKEKIDTAKLEKLTTELEQLREKQPDNINIRILQASAAVFLKDNDKAERELKRAIEECNEPLIAELRLISFYYQNKRSDEAVKLCNAACQKHTDSAEPWLYLAELYSENKDYSSALSSLRQGLNTVASAPQKRLIAIRLAMTEILNGDRKTGIDMLAQQAAKDTQEIQARLLLLDLRETRSDSAKAEKLVAELKQAEGQSGLWWRLHQASVWLNSSQWREKQRDIAELMQYCISEDPAWSAPSLLLIDMYDKMNDSKKIEDTARQALARNPSSVEIADKLLLLLEKSGRISDAENILKQVETNWKVTSAWQVRIALRTGDISRAVNELKLRASNDEKDAASRIQLARLTYQQTSDLKQAMEYLNQAEAINPDSLAVTSAKASILKADGQTEEAMQVMNEYVKNHNSFNAYFMRALYLNSEGEYEQAENDYKTIASLADSGTAGYELLCSFYVSRQRIDRAVSVIEEAIAKFPENLALQRILMKLLFPAGPVQDRARAMKILALLEAKLPGDPEIMKFRALQLIEEGTQQSMKTAQDLLVKVIKLEPSAVDAHLILVDIAMRTGQYNIARDYASQALGANPDNPLLLSARGRAELAIGNIKMAVDLAHLALQKDPKNGDARDVLVKAALSSGDNDLLKEARTLIDSAEDNNAPDEKLLISRAYVLTAMKVPGEAIPGLETYCGTEKGSKSVLAVITLADLYRLTGEMDKAEQKIEQANNLSPNNQIVIHSKFLLLLAGKRSAELEKISDQYLSASEQKPEILTEAATILLSLESVKLKEDGIKLLEKVVSLNPESVNARISLASAIYQMGNIERAEQMYRQLLVQYPNDIRVLNDLAWIIQENQEKYDEALNIANKGLKIAPSDLHLLDTRGTILSKMPNQLSEARKDFEKLVTLYPAGSKQQAKSLLKLGRICVRLNDSTGAKQYLQNALDIDRKSEIFTQAERQEISEILK